MYTQTMLEEGLMCEPVDITLNPLHDVTKDPGEMLVISLILRCIAGSLVVLGPPCKLYVYLSRSLHGRTIKNIQGKRNAMVRLGNKIARFTANVMALCHMRGVTYFIEQPSTSILWHIGCMKRAIKKSRGNRVTWHMFCYGGATPKPENGYTNAGWWKDFKRISLEKYRTMEMPRERIASVGDRKKWTKIVGVRHAESAAYPRNFCLQLIALQFE